jgi:hypothetical protein
VAIPTFTLLAAHPKGRRLAGLALVFLALAVVAALVAREAGPPAADSPKALVLGPPPLRSADPAVTLVMIEPPEAAIWADIHGSADFPTVMDRAQGITAAVGQALRRGVSDDLSGVEVLRLHLRADGVDRFGHDVMAPLMTLQIKRRALQRATGSKVLGLADSVALNSPGSFDAVTAWCRDPARSDPAFCAKPRSAVIGPLGQEESR